MSVSLDGYVVRETPINVGTSGKNVIVQAVTNKEIWVLRCVLMSSGDVTATFHTGQNGSNITGPFPLIASTGFSLPQEEGQYVSSWFKTRVGDALVLNLSASVSVGGVLSYIEVEGETWSSSSSSCRSSSSSSSSSSCRSSSSSSSSNSISSSSSSCRSSSSSCRSSSSSSSSTNP